MEKSQLCLLKKNFNFACTLVFFLVISHASWADYGFIIKDEGNIPITKFTVIGERASGSNYMEALLMFNTKVTSVPFYHKHFGPWFELPAEKYFGPAASYTFEGTDDYLFIVIVRNAYDWVRSLHQQPHLASPKLLYLPFSQFIRSTWLLNEEDPLYKAQVKLNPWIDRDPQTQTAFENVLKLRTAKARNMLMIKEKAKNVYYINYETARDFPKAVLDEISKHYKIALNPTFYPIMRYKGHTALPLYKGSNYAPLSQQDLQYIDSQLDQELEKKLGYELTPNVKDEVKNQSP